MHTHKFDKSYKDFHKKEEKEEKEKDITATDWIVIFCIFILVLLTTAPSL